MVSIASIHKSHFHLQLAAIDTMIFAHLLPLLGLLTSASALPTTTPSKPLPLLIWHGLGDKFDNPGLLSTGELAQKIHPGTYVHYIRVANDSSADRTATFFGNITAQIVNVCTALHDDPFLSRDGTIRADALGFSQGGQFLRGLLERCEGLSVRSLVTFGSQHNGIAQFQACGTYDFVCKGASALVGGNAWTDYVQSRVIPAQYFRPLNATTGEPEDGYLEHSHFLADVNNEKVLKNEAYKAKVSALEKFVMYVFSEDKTVVPKESGWFAEVNATSEVVTPLRERPIYKEDWLGLKALDEKGGLIFKTTPGGHMDLEEEVLVETFAEHFGSERGVLSAGVQAVSGTRQSWWTKSLSEPKVLHQDFL